MRYRTFVDILGYPREDKEVRRARAAIAHEPAVKHLLEQRNEAGYWGTPEEIFKWWPKRNTTFWVLGILADLGLTRTDCGIERACEYVFSAQLPGGAFGSSPPPTPCDCFTGILAGALARLGYVGDERLEAAYGWLTSRLRIDGGFWCKNTGLPGGPREREPSCALASLWVLSALTAHPAFRESEACKKCAVFLLRCWDCRGKIKYAGHDSQIGSGWEKLKYPFSDYRILHYLDVLSSVLSVRNDARIVEMADLLTTKSDQEGRFQPESIHEVWSEFDFGQKKHPSRWLTCLVYRVLTRLEQGVSG